MVNLGAQAGAHAGERRLATAAMGTRFEIVLAAGAGDLMAAGEAAIAEICDCHARLSRFASDSLVSHLARTAPATPVRLDGETFRLFADAIAVWRASGGAFDITVGPLMAAHGYTPSAVAGDAGRGSETIVLDEERWTVSFRSGGIGLDFGAIAKGHALDLAGAVLREAGVTAALLHGGTSSVLAIGAPEEAEGWAVAVPFDQTRHIVTLRDSALAVSDPASQSGDGGAAHIMDPRSGRPVGHPLRVAVLGPSARLCDGWSTALAVLGTAPDGFPGDYRAIFEAHTA
jgi:thiamine biosynthesis lipoprotein